MKIKKSLGAILIKQNQKLIIDYFDLPKNLLRGQVLVKVKLTGVCGSQIGEIKGIKGKDIYLPHLLGHEGVGHVLERHNSVKKVKPGDRVLLHWMPSKGYDALAPKYRWKNKVLNAGKLTTFNEYAVVSENRVTKISRDVTDKNAVLLGCTASTAIGSVRKIGKVSKNSTVVVAGCGLIGQFIIKLLKKDKIKKIIAIDNKKTQLELAKKNGANEAILFERNYKKKLHHLRNKINFFFECSGNIEILNHGFEILKFNGTEILIGVTKKGKFTRFNPLEINLGKKIKGSKGGSFKPDKDLSKFNELLKDKKLLAKDLIHAEYNITDINKIIKRMILGKILKKPIIRFY